MAARRGVVRGRVRQRGAGRGRGRVRLSLGRGVGSGPRVRSGGPALVPARGRARGAGLTAGAVGRHRGPPRVVGGRVAARVDGRALRRAGVRVRAGTGLRSGRGGRGRASGSARGGARRGRREGAGWEKNAPGRAGMGFPRRVTRGDAPAPASARRPSRARVARARTPGASLPPRRDAPPGVARGERGDARGRHPRLVPPESFGESDRSSRRASYRFYSALSSSRRPLRCVARACGSCLASRSSRSLWRARRRLPRPRPPPRRTPSSPRRRTRSRRTAPGTRDRRWKSTSAS